MLNIITLGLKQNKFYELNELRSALESLQPIVIIAFVPVFVLVVGFFIAVFSSTSENMIAEVGLLLLTLVVTLIVIIGYEESRPIPVKNKEAFIKAVEDGEYKGVYFLSDEEEKGKVQYDIHENILYLTKQSMLEENYDNAIKENVDNAIKENVDNAIKENVEEEVAEENEENLEGEIEEDLIAVNQQVKKFKKGSKYQTTLVDEGTPNEHMLLIELVVDGAVIKLDEYAYIENQKRYKVERLDENFVMLKKENPK